MTQLEQIGVWLQEHSYPSYRLRQVEQAWYTLPGWEQVTTLPDALRKELAATFPWFSLTPSLVATSPFDGTKKSLLTLHDGQKIESVCMPNARGKRTVCISSQVGCGMGCTFCATGTMGLVRNLTVDEIVDQVRFWHTAQDETISNIVFMGMGEPLANYDAVKEAAHLFIEKMDVGPTRITVSTVGFMVGLKKLLTDTDFPPVRVALSLHAGTDATRSSIVPTHKATSMKKLFEWIEAYLNTKGNRRHHLTLEYVMLNGVNDMPEEARALAKLFAPIKEKIKLNLIPWNPTAALLKRSEDSHLHAFQDITEKAGITTTIRYSKGLDIEAACGQLVVKEMEALAKKQEKK